MEEKNYTPERVTENATRFAEFALEQMKLREPAKLEGKAISYWTIDHARLEETVERANNSPSFDNAKELTNLACGLMKIYQDYAYTKLNERGCERK